jgi:hypothetical protein
MRITSLVLGFALAALSPFTAMAENFDTPDALLTALYAPFQNGGDGVSDYAPFFSKQLNGLYAHDDEITPDGEMGAIDFDPVVDAQDFDVSKVEVGAAGIAGDYASADVTFNNFGEPKTISYDLVKEDGSWKVDDISRADGEYPWRLSEIFATAAAAH